MKSHNFTSKGIKPGFTLAISLIIALLLVTQIGYSQNQSPRTSEVTPQTVEIKGLVTDGTNVLKDVNVVQKGTKNGTVTNAQGEFTFPVRLKVGDVLLFSYLGYETQTVIIKEDTTFITLTLTEDLIEMMGALNTDVPYKSKRKN